MSIIERLKGKITEQQGQQLEEIAQPMLDRISDRIAGGAGAVWCRASWGSGCDHVNIKMSEL